MSNRPCTASRGAQSQRRRRETALALVQQRIREYPKDQKIYDKSPSLARKLAADLKEEEQLLIKLGRA